MAPKHRHREGKGYSTAQSAPEEAKFDWKRYGDASQIRAKMAELVQAYAEQIQSELTRLGEANEEAKQIIVKAGLASGRPFKITFSEEIMELDVPQFKFLEFEKQRAAKFLLAQLEDIEHGRMENMLRERAACERQHEGANSVLPMPDQRQLPRSDGVAAEGQTESGEDEQTSELEELEALASAENGPFPTEWGGMPAFQGFAYKHKNTLDKATQTDTQYTAQLVTVGPPSIGEPSEKIWHFHNGMTMGGGGAKRLRTTRTAPPNTNTERKKSRHHWRNTSGGMRFAGRGTRRRSTGSQNG
jgi:hypothetical protein